jgi:hypothetical protein
MDCALYGFMNILFHFARMKLPVKALHLLDNTTAHPEVSTLVSEEAK